MRDRAVTAAGQAVKLTRLRLRPTSTAPPPASSSTPPAAASPHVGTPVVGSSAPAPGAGDSPSPPPVPPAASSSSAGGVAGVGLAGEMSSACSHGTSTTTSPTYHGGSGPRLIHAASVVGAVTTTSSVRVSPRWISTGLYCNPNVLPASGPLVISVSGSTP